MDLAAVGGAALHSRGQSLDGGSNIHQHRVIPHPPGK